MKRNCFLHSLVIIFVVLLFALFNLSIYFLFTARLDNNFSDTTRALMIDVKKYLPYEESSDLARIDCSLKLMDNLPVLDGAAALVPVYASVIENVYPEGSVTYDGGEFSDDNFYGENFAADSKMQYKNTVRGYKAIVDGKTDILFCASPSDEQVGYAKEKGVQLVYVPIGLEAFVFFVNKNNPVDNLSVEEIRSVYSGEIKNWKALGGQNRVINPVTRLSGSGSQSAMDRFMGDKKIAKKSPFAILGGSLGFSFRYYLNDMVSDNSVKMLSVNGIYPNEENIKNRSYPVISEFYAIYRRDNKNPNIQLLVEWLLSEEGQTLIKQCGYIPIN